MHITLKKLVGYGMLVMAIFAITWTPTAVSAEKIKLKTAEGKITSMTNGIIVLNDKMAFYPAMEIDVPTWAVVGEKVGMSYDKEGKKNRYYEIVKPGAKYKIKEELENQHKKLH